MTPPATAPPLIRSLQEPSCYPHAANDLQLIETHISWVILAGDYAYKIKKPVNLGFLDFSTLEKRRHCCREELRLNSRLAPEIYLDLVALRGTALRPRFGEDGTAFEYAVKMRRFDPNLTFDRLLQRRLLESDQLRETARIIASFHDRIARAATDSEYGDAAAVMRPIKENFAQIESLAEIEKPGLLAALAHWSECESERLHGEFALRKDGGFVRECHGDLHLGNIVLLDGRPVPFDGIEFNPSLYWIDVISEVAFLVMDLDDNGRTDLAFCFLNEYLQHTGDYRGLALLRFYLVYRAMVRAKVYAIRAGQLGANDRRRPTVDSYLSYLRLANDYTRPAPARLLLMHGVSGSGKSWLSDRILERLPAIRIRSDVERKRLFHGASRQQSGGIGHGLYGADATQQTYLRLLTLAADILAAGYNVVVDATFLQYRQRRPFFELAERTATPLAIIDTVAEPALLRQRLQKRAERADNVSDADLEVMEHQLQHLPPLSERELEYTFRVDTENAERLTQLWTFLDEFKA